MATFFFPYPPSINTYWGFQGHRRYLTPKAVAFKAAVAHGVNQLPDRFYSSRLELVVHLFPPDKRTRDIDNVLKPLLDAMVQAGLFEDDSQVDKLSIERMRQTKGGAVAVTITNRK